MSRHDENEYDELIESEPITEGVSVQPGGNEYDDALESERGIKKRDVRQRLIEAQRHTPEQAAKDARMGDQLGVSSDRVSRNRDLAEQATTVDEAESTDYDELIDQYDRLADWLRESPDNARVTQGDLSTLKQLHGVLRPAKPEEQTEEGSPAAKSGLDWLTSAVPGAFEQGQSQAELAQIGYRQMMGMASERDLERAAELERQITGDNYGAEGWWEEAVVEASRQLPIVGGGMMQGAERGAQSAATFMTGAGLFSPPGSRVASMPAAGLTGGVVGFRIGAAEYAFQLEGGLAFREFRDIRTEDGRRIDEGAARMAAMLSGTLSAGAETVGIEALARTVPGADRLLSKAGRDGIKQALKQPSVARALSKLAQRYAGVVGIESLTEGIQEASQIVGAELAKGLDQGEGEFAEFDMQAAIDRVAAASKAGAQAASILGAPGPTSRFVGDSLRARQAQKNQQTFEELGRVSEASETRTRSPDKFREFVERVREGGPVESVHVPIERWQSYWDEQGVDAAEMANEVTGDNKQYAEATATGGDLVIPIERYTEKVAPTEHHTGLIQDLRLRPGDMTAREADEFMRNIPPEQRESATGAAQSTQDADAAEGQAEGEATGTEQRQRPTQGIYDDVLGQLLNTGYERSSAEANANLIESAFRSLGERSGIDPQQLYERYGLTVRREIPELLADRETVESIDPLLDRLRAGEIPSEREARGPSLTEFLREEGGVVESEEGGELSNRDIDVDLQPFQRRMIRPDGETGAMSLEEAAQRASEAGYFDELMGPDSSASDASETMLLDAIDREMRGEPVYAEAKRDTKTERTRQQLTELSDFIEQLGVDLDAVDNDVVRAVLSGNLPPEYGQRRDTEASDTSVDDETVLSQAQQAGYEGADAGEARAWLEARQKGLDLSQGARLQRAQEQGFDTSKALYHGTAGDVQAFDPESRGSSTRASSAQQAYFFTDEPKIAEDFANLARTRGEGGSPNVMPVYLRMENPLEVDGGELTMAQAVERAQANGNDGVIVYEAQDSPRPPTLTVDGEALDVDSRGSFLGETLPAWMEGEGVTREQAQQELDETVEFNESELREAQQALENAEGEAQRRQAQEDVDTFQQELETWRTIAEAWRDDPSRVTIEQNRVSDVHIVFDPSQVRSIHAAFDPEAIASEELLAQSAQPGTEAFQRWFGDSQVVDENGDPLVVYHGTGGDFSEFSLQSEEFEATNFNALGFWFDTRPEAPNFFAERPGGNVMPAYLSIENPLVIGGMPISDEVQQQAQQLAQERRWKELGELERSLAGDAMNKLFEMLPEGAQTSTATVREIVEDLKAVGYDGIQVRNTLADAGAREGIASDWWVAFEPEQIKSAVGNRGTFDPDSPNILEQGPVPDPQTLEEAKARIAELETELRTDDMTGLRNRRAFDEDAGLGWPIVGALDMDGLNRLNNLSHDAGDAVIEQMGAVLLNAESDDVRFYRTGGDEFAARFRNSAEAEPVLADLQQRLENINVELDVVDENGNTETIVYEGIGLTYGVGPDAATADARAVRSKEERERLGLREPKGDGPPRRARRATDRPRQGDTTDEQLTLFQGQAQPRLSALHNLSAENLKFADSMGGLAVPSIAVQREGQQAVSGFGEITLVGGRTLADPSAEPVFESDAYSARFPQPEYPKVATKKADAFMADLRPWIQSWNSEQGARVITGEANDYLTNTPDPEHLYSRLRRESGIQAMFLKQEKGLDVEPVYGAPELSEPYLDTEAFRQWREQAEQIPSDYYADVVSRVSFGDETLTYYAIFDGDGNQLTGGSTNTEQLWSDLRQERVRPSSRDEEAWAALSQAVERAIDEYAEAEAARAAQTTTTGPTDAESIRKDADLMRQAFRSTTLDENGLLLPQKMQRIEQDERRLAAGQEYKPTASRERIEEAMTGREAEFDRWLRQLVQSPFSDPKVTVKGRKRQYTLGNIVDAMISDRVKGDEQTMTFGLGNVRAAGAKQFPDVETMRAQAAESVDPDNYEAAREESERMASEWRETMVEYFRFDDTWEAFDNSMQAIARLLNYSQQTKANLRKALNQTDFQGDRVPDEVLEQGVALAEQLKTAPVPYFEAKPQRAVPLAEFKGAAIPSDTPADVREILARHDIATVEYNPAEGRPEGNANRTAAVNQLQAELADDVLFQRRETGPRGRIRFARADGREGRQFTIELMENADLSTFLHESGHFFLEIMGDLAADPEASQQIKDDYASVLNWMGVSSREEIGAEQHEQWARAFEAYLFEGNAPTPELQGAFAKFRAWLVSIYRQLRALNVQLTDEVRGVMDRLLATSEEIDNAREEQNYAPIFESAETANMSQAEYAEYQRLIQQARNEAEEELSKRALNQKRREEKAWWRDLREQVRAEVQAEIDADRGYQAMYFLQRGELPDGRRLPEGVEAQKLSKDILVQRYGQSFLKRLPRPYVYTKAGGVDPDYVAELFGFGSGDELVRRLAELPARRKAIEAETDQRMQERFGDILTDGSLPEEAMRAVHNERRSDLLSAELRALGRQSGARPQPGAVLKQSAQRVIGQKTVAQIRPEQYRRAEAKAAREAFDAAVRQDFQAAYQAKQRQLFNHHLYREATQAREDVDNIVAYLSRFEKKRVRQRIGKAGPSYLEQINNLLERFEFKRSVSLRRIRQRQSFRAWLSEQTEESAADFQLDPELARFLEESQRVNYRELTYEALSGLRDSVKFIDHMARTKNRLMAQADQRNKEEAVADIVSSIEANHTLAEETLDLAPSWNKKLKEFTNQAVAEHTKPEFLFQYLDGDRAAGPVWQRLYKPLQDAHRAELRMTEDIISRYQDIWSQHSRRERRGWYSDKRYVEELGVSMNKASILSMALNWGNQQNRDAMLEGYGWTQGQVEAVLQRNLTQKDWDAVQATWDLIDSMWPQIQALEERVNGIAPQKVDPTPVQTAFGQYRGGYYPLKYDSTLSIKALRNAEREGSRDLFENNYARAATKKGHTIERVGSGGQKVRLDMGVATEHLYQVIHDLTHREAIQDVDRLTADNRVQSAIERTAGRQMYRQIRPWLQSLASEQWQPTNAVERILSRARAGATVANMGWKVTTAIVQPLGYLQSVRFLGEKYAWKGLSDFYGGNARKAWRFVSERSEEMNNRQKAFDRDVKDAGRRLQQAGHFDSVRESFFYLIGLMDMSVSVPTWLGAYRKAMEGAAEGIEAGDENAAIDFADQAVRMSQSAGNVKDLAGIQRHHEMFRLFTMFYSYFNAFFNMLSQDVRAVREGRISKPKFMAHMLYLWFIPSVMGELVAGRGPEEDEEWIPWAIRHEILYLSGSMVGVRDLANAALTPFRYQGSPAFDAVGTTAQALQIPYDTLVEGEDFERSDAKAITMAVSYWGALPGRQSWITGEYIYDLMTGQDQPESVQDFLHDAAFGRPADER